MKKEIKTHAKSFEKDIMVGLDIKEIAEWINNNDINIISKIELNNGIIFLYNKI